MFSELVESRLICCACFAVLATVGTVIRCAPTASHHPGLSSELEFHNIEGNSNGMLLYDGRTVAELFYDRSGRMLKHCHLYDLDDARKTAMLKERHGNEIVQNTDFKTMLDLIVRCRDLEEVVHDDTPLPGNLTESSSWSLLDGIVPGTKWCGLGDIADNYNDLGSRSNVDVCCRAHDHCPIRLKAFRTGFGLINLSIYTKSHCDCDEDFLRCLKQTNSQVADLIGNFYFNVLKVQCIREEHPLKCVASVSVSRRLGLDFQRLLRATIEPSVVVMTLPAELPRYVFLKDLLTDKRYRLTKSMFSSPLHFTFSFDSKSAATLDNQALCHRWELDRSTTRMKIITPALVY